MKNTNIKRKPIITKRKPVMVPTQETHYNRLLAPYGYIYISTDAKYHKNYIGKKETMNFDPTYFGSGTIVSKAYAAHPEAFSVRPIDWAYSKEELNQKEQYWIEFLGAAESQEWYNILAGGDGGRLTGDSLERMRKSRMGKCTGKDNPNYGGLKESAKEKLRIYNTGRKLSEETKRKIGEKSRGRRHTESSKEKLRQAHLGVTLSEESKQKISKNRKGKRAGEDHPLYGTHVPESRKQHLREVNLYGGSARAKKLYQYDLHGNLVFEYQSRSQVVTQGFVELDIPKISTICCQNDRSDDVTYVFRNQWIFSSEPNYSIKKTVYHKPERS